MHNLVRTFDALLNRFTMYRVVLYGLIGLLVIADGLAFTGAVSIGPVALLVSTATLLVTCYVANRMFVLITKAATNTESWLVTALILACILPPAETAHRVLLTALCALIAIASKFIIVYRGSHFLNPAAAGALVMSVTGLLAATWWVATPALAPFTALLALIVLRKQRKFSLFFAFAIVAFGLLLYVGALQHQGLASVAHSGALSWPIVFMGSIMLTEPITLPPTRYYQMLFGVLVGAVFACQLHLGPFTSTPEASLIVGNLLTVLAVPSIGAMIKLKSLSKLTDNIFELTFEKPRLAAFSFAPGQYLEWTLPHAHSDARGNRRIFSIASAPTEPDLTIALRTYEKGSSFKRALTALTPGKSIRVAHVAGNFSLPPNDSGPLLFIAGGIGITPFRSMIAELVATKQSRDIFLLYTAASPGDFIFTDLFDRAKSYGVQTKTLAGRLDARQLTEAVPDVLKRQVYISGPDAMVTNYRLALERHGVSGSHIHTDYFSGY